MAKKSLASVIMFDHLNHHFSVLGPIFFIKKSSDSEQFWLFWYQLLIAFHWGRAFHCTFKKCWICVISLQRTNQIAWNFLWCFVRFCLAYINGQYAYALWWTADMILGKSPLPKLAKFPVQTFFIGHALRNYSEYSLV